MELMADGLWVSGRSHDAIAAEFGVAPATVKDWATSASRVLRLHVAADPEELRARLVATLETVVATAMGKHEELHKFAADGDAPPPVKVPTPDLRNAVAAIAEQGKLLGLHTEHHVHSGAVTEDQLIAFRAAIVAVLCETCRAKVLEHVRGKTKETTT